MEKRQKIRKQAVVIVHGMGEQRPLATLRSFVEAVWATDASQTARRRMEIAGKTETGSEAVEPNQYWIAPDSRAGSYELRRITTPANDSQLRTDFYEFYWADIMTGSRPGHLWGWLMGLLFRNPNTVPGHALTLWYSLWAFFAFFVLAVLSVISLAAGESLLMRLADHIGSFFGLLFLIGLIAGIATIGAILLGWMASRRGVLTSVIVMATGAALYLLSQPCCGAEINFLWSAPRAIWVVPGCILLLSLFYVLVLPYFGDVARYVRASPGNVEKRQAVRQRGLELLRKLHDSKEYERIILVGHSLGSVIAYDLLTIFWADRGPSNRHPLSKASSALLEEIDDIASLDRRQIESEPAGIRFEQVMALRDKQRALSRSLAEEKDPWLISDLVTLGSPLTHAEFLVAESPNALERLRHDRMISLCPPDIEEAADGKPGAPPSMLYESRLKSGAKVKLPHHAAVFSCVRWTNIYDQPSFIIFGDFVSGALQRLFHWGVRDVRVRIETSRIPLWRRVFTHTCYWTNFTEGSVDRHIAELRSAIDLLDIATPLAAPPNRRLARR